MPTVTDSDYWWESSIPLEFQQQEFYPKGILGDALHYNFKPGVMADITLCVLDITEANIKLAPAQEYGTITNDIFENAAGGYIQPDNDSGPLVPVSHFISVRPYQVITMSIPTVADGKDGDNRGRVHWGERLIEIYHNTTDSDSTPWFADTASVDINNLCKLQDLWTGFYGRRLPTEDSINRDVVGSGIATIEQPFVAVRIKITDYPPGLSRDAGIPQLFHAGRIAIGHF